MRRPTRSVLAIRPPFPAAGLAVLATAFAIAAGLGAEPTAAADDVDDADVAALVAAAPAAPRIADHAAMEAALRSYAARATRRTAPGGAEDGAARAPALEPAIAGARAPKAAGPAGRVGRGGAVPAVPAGSDAVGDAEEPPAPVGTGLAPGSEPAEVDGWRSFDMATTDYLGSNGAIAAGPDAVLALANGVLRAWDKDGAPLMEPTSLDDWFAPLADALVDEFDMAVRVVAPRAAFAVERQRYVVSAIALPEEGDWPILFVGVSATGDPAGRYCIARVIPMVEGDPEGLGILDYSLTVNDHALAMAVNLYERQPDGTATNFAARAFVERLNGLLDCTARDSSLHEVYAAGDFERFNNLYAADTLGGGDTTAFVGSHDGAGALLQPVVMPWTGEGLQGPLGELTPVSVPSYRFPPDGTQPGTDVAIATGWANVRSAVYLGPRDLWTSQAVEVGTSAGMAWRRLTLQSVALDGGVVSLNGADLYHAQILPALECDAAMIAFNYSSATIPVSAGVMQLGADTMTPVAQGDGCVAWQDDPTMPWDQRVPIAYDPYDELLWLHPSVADGASRDCTANQWATHVVWADWDLCGTTGPGPTPPPTGDRKGIGFALGSKRYMRGVQGPSGAYERGGAMRGAAMTGIQVQNIDGVRTAQPAVEFAEQRSPYGGPTGVFVRTIDMPTIPPGASLNTYLPALDLLDAMYRVTITTPRDGGDLSAILRTDWDTGGAAIVSNLWFSDRVVLPRVVRAANTHTSVIAVTNAGSDTARVTLQFYRAGSGAVVATKQFDMGPAEALTFDLNDADPAFSALGDGFVGSVIMESACCQVGAQVYEYAENSALAIGGYEGIPAGQASSQLYVPLFRHQQHGPGGIRLDTAVAVANAGDGEARVQVTYFPTSNASASEACRSAGPIVHGPVTIPGYSSHAFFQGPGGGHGLPANCFGSAVVEALEGGVVATVLDVQNGNEQLSMINASPAESAATKHALPLFRSRHLVAEYTTGIQVMNAGDRAATVHIDFSRSEGNVTFPITGCRGQCDAVIPPNEAYTWWPPSVDVIPPDTYGAAVIESDQPIVVLVNDYPLRGGSDMATYAGIPVGVE